MNRLRFRISTLMALVLLAAAVFATGRISNDIEVPVMLGGALMILGALGTGILGVIYGRGKQRAFWVGFTLFGWLFVLPCLVMALGELEILLIVPIAVPFAWIGGVIARGFAAGNDDLRASPDKSSDAMARDARLGDNEMTVPSASDGAILGSSR